MKKINNALKYLFRDTRYFIVYCFRYFQPNYRCRAEFYCDNEVAELIKKGKSILRIGDGEIGLLHFNTSDYQPYSDAVRRDFLESIIGYGENSSYILGIPIYVNYMNCELSSLGVNKQRLWMPLKVTFDLIFNKERKYIDAHLFYRDNKIDELIVPYLAAKKVILVTNEDNKKEVSSTSLEVKIFDYVVCPKRSAYESRLGIKNRIIEIINQSRLPKTDFVILLSAGMAKTIIIELSQSGYQLIDVGKGFEGYAKNISLEHLTV